jgi:hypothetical protein
MDSVSIRPRLDRRFDVIQSRFPQLIGTRDTKADALALAEWAAKRIAPCHLVVFGEDGATIEESRDVAGAGRPAPAAGH